MKLCRGAWAGCASLGNGLTVQDCAGVVQTDVCDHTATHLQRLLWLHAAARLQMQHDTSKTFVLLGKVRIRNTGGGVQEGGMTVALKTAIHPAGIVAACKMRTHVRQVPWQGCRHRCY